MSLHPPAADLTATPPETAPMRFGASFDLDVAQVAQDVPLHVRWVLEDVATLLGSLRADFDTLLWHNVGLLVLALFLLLMWSRAALRLQRIEAGAEVEVAAMQAALYEHVDATERIRDCLVQRRFGEALYQANRALEGY